MAVVKTAISIDRELFDAGERMARDLNVTRSELYARALSSLLKQQRRQAIKEQINAVEAALTAEERAEEDAITEGLRRMTSETLRLAAERGDIW